MEVQIIECSKIEEVVKAGKELRKFSRDFAVRLSESIKTEGLLQAIVVRPNPEKSGYFILVAGKHRLYAVQKVLKEQCIEANVLQDFDPKDHEMALIAENLWHNPLTRDQMTLSLKKWYEYFASRHGERSATEVARAAKKAKATAAVETKVEDKKQLADQSGLCDKLADSDAGAEETAVAATEASSEASFTRNVAAATGTSQRTAQRLLRIAKLFSDDELETFRQCYTSKDDQERIAKVKDAALRSQIVALIASGMEVEDAFKSVLGEAPVKGGSGSNEVKAAKAESKEERVPVLTDEEWYETYCGDKAALIDNDKAKFKSDALFYRAISEARNVFHAKVKKALALHKLPAGQNGPFYFQVKKVANISGPKDWFLCGGCNSTGLAADGMCEECYGAGYKTKTEDY